ncbi:MAG: serine/threonine-protein kinase HipA [Candidatus Eremiobacteraeota bacterium]|jgi:serine/threonine-protein kinase HipA|nr:serine/threonine-protein kinase HipA [Candidatus Eremiobacteraeota bacterium]
MDRLIEVYADWTADALPRHLGTLRARPGRTSELFDFTFDDDALTDQTLSKNALDPDLGLFAGPQFPKDGRSMFGVFKDSSPDRWGETLIRRRFDRDKRAGLVPLNARLVESDYLLGVHDEFRSGALRYKRKADGAFLDDRDGSAAPPFIRLRELEAASRALEGDVHDDDPATDEWLRLLLAPGASLGGARPKATIADVEGNLWIAKFPSAKDRYDVGAWEFVVAKLAERCGLRVPRSDARMFATSEHTFLVKRFDRHTSGPRIHFASAMTLTGHTDGAGASTGASYLEIAEIIMSQGAAPREDLVELWSRIVFNIMVSNTDDHLRNHGFVLAPNAGWRLSPGFDMNPVPGSSGLALNIDESDNALDLDLVRSVAPYFRIKDVQATSIIDRIADVVRGWSEIAGTVGITRREQGEMADAFMIRQSA